MHRKCIVVTDMGTSFTGTMSGMAADGHFKLFTSYALCSMGFGLPGAIGAYFADPTKTIVCIAGDGGLQMNIQELQTIVQYKIPMKIFVLNNSGYAAITSMQDNLFKGEHAAATAETGVSSPIFTNIAKAYGIPTSYIIEDENLFTGIRTCLSTNQAMLCEIKLDISQPQIPKVQSYTDEQGKIRSSALDHMFPYLDANYENFIKESLNDL